MRRLFQLPQVLREPGDSRRRIEDDFGAVQAEKARAFGEVAVVADVDADRREPRLEDRVAEVARLEEVLLPESGRVRDVIFPVFPEVRPVGVVHRRRVVVHAGRLSFVHGHDDRHAMPAGVLRHQLGRRTGHRLGDVVPVGVLRRAEVRTVEHFLQAENLDAASAGFVDERQVDVDRGLSDLFDRDGWVAQGGCGLNQAPDYSSRHQLPPGGAFYGREDSSCETVRL